MKKVLAFALGLTLVFAACKRNDGPGEGQANNASGDFSDFEAFYNRFMTDSIYQMEHIIFPLEGIPDHADSTKIRGTSFRWTKEGWVMHRKFDPANSGYKVEFIPFGNDLMVENITHHSGQYGMMRRFAKLNNEWQLIYYVGMNAIQKKQDGVNINGGFQEEGQ